jgi:hypothetical protein
MSSYIPGNNNIVCHYDIPYENLRFDSKNKVVMEKLILGWSPIGFIKGDKFEYFIGTFRRPYLLERIGKIKEWEQCDMLKID